MDNYKPDVNREKFDNKEQLLACYKARKAWCAKFEEVLPTVLRILEEQRVPMPDRFALGSLHWERRFETRPDVNAFAHPVMRVAGRLNMCFGLDWGDTRSFRLNIGGSRMAFIKVDVEDTLQLVKMLRAYCGFWKEWSAEFTKAVDDANAVYDKIKAKQAAEDEAVARRWASYEPAKVVEALLEPGFVLQRSGPSVVTPAVEVDAGGHVDIEVTKNEKVEPAQVMVDAKAKLVFGEAPGRLEEVAKMPLTYPTYPKLVPLPTPFDELLRVDPGPFDPTALTAAIDPTKKE